MLGVPNFLDLLISLLKVLKIISSDIIFFLNNKRIIFENIT